MNRIARVAARAQRELDIARAETKSLNKVISGLQQRLDALEARGSVGSDHPPLESGSSDDGWGPGPGPGRPHAPGGAPRSRPSASAPSFNQHLSVQRCKYSCFGRFLAPSGLLSWVKGIHGHKSLLAKPHVALGTHFINLKSHDTATVSL